MRKDDAIRKLTGKCRTYYIPTSLWQNKNNKSTLCFCFFVVFYNRRLTNDLMSVMNYQSTIALTAGTNHFLQLCSKFQHVLHRTEINRGIRPLILSNVHGDWNKLTGFRYHRGMIRTLRQILTKVKWNSSKFWLWYRLYSTGTFLLWICNCCVRYLKSIWSVCNNYFLNTDDRKYLLSKLIF